MIKYISWVLLNKFLEQKNISFLQLYDFYHFVNKEYSNIFWFL